MNLTKLSIICMLLSAVIIQSSYGQGNSTQCPKTDCEITYEIEGSSCDLLLQNVTATIVSLLPQLVGILEKPLQINVSIDKPDTEEKSVEDAIPEVKLAQDCTDLAIQGFNTSGVYQIQPLNHAIGQSHGENTDSFPVFCDMETDGGGWTAFQRREDGAITFYRGWQQYKKGFGHLNTEHWLGLDKLHHITAQGRYELRIDLTKFTESQRHVYAKYDNFRIGDESTDFKLLLGDYSGTAGNYLRDHASMRFSTFDNDNDDNYSNCAIRHKGAWWYNSGDCLESNLNGLYLGHVHDREGIFWGSSNYWGLKATEMKIRRVK